MTGALAVYIHWPYCLAKCPYCDFASRPAPEGLDERALVRAYEREIAAYAAALPGRRVESVYIGGGTPSLMRPETLAALLSAVAKGWALAPQAEVTIEANPAAAEAAKFQAFRAAGANRVSLGVQSFSDARLRFLGRAHDALAARRALEAAASHFSRFSFDLIYATQGQTVDDWRAELDVALSFAPRHLSLYQLTIEEGTPFFKRARHEPLVPDEDLSAALYETTQDILGAAGLPSYEISSHAAPGEESRHNLAYWRYQDYVGLGPGAHGRFVDETGARLASENLRAPEAWQAEVARTGFGCVAPTRLLPDEAMREAVMMGLRETQGLDTGEAWRQKFGGPVQAVLDADRVEALVREGLLRREGAFLSATAQGRLRLNAVLAHVLARG